MPQHSKYICPVARRIHTSAIPAYQKALPDNDPSKIQFRFAVIENKKYRSEICSFDGLILIPRPVLERLKSDDQLAAVLADGVAFNLQRQAARLTPSEWAILGAKSAADVAGFFVPGLGLTAWGGSIAEQQKIQTRVEEQRGRIALALLSDANYDLRQSPEAWRLLTPNHLPANLDSLKYPNRSGYQLSILNLQYRATPLAVESAQFH